MTESPSGTETRAREARKVALATFVGTTLEWYDFFLYALCAALVFGPLFFPSDDAVTGQLGALATLTVGFIARPLGGIIAGHFGDRVGRKKLLVVTLLLMGSATVAVGILPTYGQIGVAAPILLVTLRIVQGLAMGGEWGGAVSMAIEHAPPNRRAFYAAAPGVGPAVGLCLANLVLLVLLALTGDAFVVWGWRIGFLSSIVLIVVGLYARRQLEESPLFEDAVASEPERVPVLEVFRSHWRTLIKLIIVAGVPGISTYMIYTYSLAYGVANLGYQRSELLWIALGTSAVSIPLTFACARLGDKLGMWPVLILGTVLQAITALLLFPLFDTGKLGFAVIASFMVVLPTCLSFACIPPLLTSNFPTRIRYTGISLAYQLGAVVGGGFAPLIATSLFASTGNSMTIGYYIAGANVLAFSSLLLLPRKYSAATTCEAKNSAIEQHGHSTAPVGLVENSAGER